MSSLKFAKFLRSLIFTAAKKFILIINHKINQVRKCFHVIFHAHYSRFKYRKSILINEQYKHAQQFYLKEHLHYIFFANNFFFFFDYHMSDNITISHFVMIFCKCSLVLLYIFVKKSA